MSGARKSLPATGSGREFSIKRRSIPTSSGFFKPFLGIISGSFDLIQIALGAISCALIFAAGRNLFSRRAGIAAGLILACYAPGVFFDGLIEKSILDFFLLSVLVVAAEPVGGDSAMEPVARPWCGSGVCWGCRGRMR